MGHFHKGKAARPAGIPVRDDLHALDLAQRIKQRPQLILGGLKTPVASKPILHFRSSSFIFVQRLQRLRIPCAESFCPASWFIVSWVV